MFHRPSFRLTACLLFVAAVPAFAQEFSADLVRQKPQGAMGSKIFVSGSKLRFEAAGNQAHSSIVVIELAERKGFMVLPEAKSYTLLKTDRMSLAMPFFRPDDPDDACAAWEAAVEKPKTCSKIGPETVNGRDAVKYKGSAHNGDTGYAWVDRTLKFVIKWEGEKTASEFQNIQEGPQAASLFKVPAGYEEVDPDAERKRQAQAKTQSKGKASTVPKTPATN